MSTDRPVCNGCAHAIARHYTDPTGAIRCLVTARGHSTSGIIGIPWETECDCENYDSPQLRQQRDAEQAEKDQAGERMRAWAEKNLPSPEAMMRMLKRKDSDVD